MNLEQLKNKTILIFGKSRAFSDNEFESQMRYHKIAITKEFSDDIEIVIEGRMMTPYEQNKSDSLYEEKKVNFISIDSLEKSLVQSIDSNTLLMSLKLSKDKNRLKDFITNSMISDELFFKLINLYNWSGEDFFENDNNRDVSAAFISRFYENIERNHNVQYATTGFIHLVAQTKDMKLLQEIAKLKPLKFHPKIISAIAMSIYCDSSMQDKFFKSDDEKILEALSLNKNLSYTLVNSFLDKKIFEDNIARCVFLTDELFTLLLKYKLSLAMNESLTLKMQDKLLNMQSNELNISLASNNTLDESVIKKLLSYENETIESLIYENNSTPVDILDQAYKNPKNHLFLSKNTNTPIDILYQLELDSRYSRFVKSNAGYGKHIQKENIGWIV